MTSSRIILYFLFFLFIGLFAYYLYPYSHLPKNIIIDKIVVLKSKRQLLTFSNGELIKSFTIAIGKVPVGDKQFQGDYKTPEGTYFVNTKNPTSAYHRNLGISYPNKADIDEARSLGKPTGGDIKIHGIRNSLGYIGRFHRWTDWTNGCIALTNPEIEDLYEHTPIGTPIIIKP